MNKLIARSVQPLFFIGVGGTTFFIDLIITLLCSMVFGFSTAISASVGFLSGFAFSFPMNRKVVFGGHVKSTRAARVQVVMYILLCLVNLLLTAAIVTFLKDVMHVAIVWAKIISTAIIAIENFFVFKYVIFSTKKEPDQK